VFGHDVGSGLCFANPLPGQAHRHRPATAAVAARRSTDSIRNRLRWQSACLLNVSAERICKPENAMAQRPIWRGHLRLALVSCPVALYSAHTDRGTIRFHLINPDTGNRIRMAAHDAETGKEVQRRDLVKGFEFKKDSYTLLTDEDFESAKVESSDVMTIEKFVDAESIDPVYFDASYYLAPDGRAGQDVYAVLREAIAKSRKTALSRVVIAQRERTIALRPMDKGLMAQTLYEERDLNNPAELFEDIADIKPDPEMVSLAMQLIERQAGRYEPADLEDRYETRLRAIIDAKLKGEGIEPKPEEMPEKSNVIDLMAALRRSLGQEAAGKEGGSRSPARRDKKPAKPKGAPQPAKPSRKRA
jgi:DNA end-binding protein Ku